MSSKPVAPGPVPVAETNPKKVESPKPENPPAKPEGSKPSRTLPTDRLNVSKQLDILRAYAAASANGTKTATVNEVAEIVKMAPTTVSMANAFLASVGLLQRTDAGSYMPSSEVISFLRAYEWDAATASHKLGPTMRNSWFGQALIPRITFAPIEEDVAVTVLGEAATAGPEYRKELRALLEFLQYGGVIVRDGTQVRLAKNSAVAEPTVRQEDSTMEPQPEPAQKPGKNVTTALKSTAGGVSFNVDVQVDMADFATWRPERIQAFFRGIAEVLAAKADVEKSGGTT